MTDILFCAGFELGLLAVGNLEETAAAASSALRGEIATTGPEQKVYIERCPYGVVYSMAAWNAPTVLSMVRRIYRLPPRRPDC